MQPSQKRISTLLATARIVLDQPLAEIGEENFMFVRGHIVGSVHCEPDTVSYKVIDRFGKILVELRFLDV